MAKVPRETVVVQVGSKIDPLRVHVEVNARGYTPETIPDQNLQNIISVINNPNGLPISTTQLANYMHFTFSPIEYVMAGALASLYGYYMLSSKQPSQAQVSKEYAGKWADYFSQDTNYDLPESLGFASVTAFHNAANADHQIASYVGRWWTIAVSALNATYFYAEGDARKGVRISQFETRLGRPQYPFFPPREHDGFQPYEQEKWMHFVVKDFSALVATYQVEIGKVEKLNRLISEASFAKNALFDYANRP
ncbi:hypothetical protein [Telluria aromaticivorans]|uniref:Uncharacterized protein n=1 Tax=Telluria aromaticivorans TaxID=2725995 RepID=A0A7Y2P123_9BURK|nr:hypothetical protein [Telluria aromaticivorans]NNG25527.1 hypothetical protein [Telluria aromaticivorans]